MKLDEILVPEQEYPATMDSDLWDIKKGDKVFIKELYDDGNVLIVRTNREEAGEEEVSGYNLLDILAMGDKKEAYLQAIKDLEVDAEKQIDLSSNYIYRSFCDTKNRRYRNLTVYLGGMPNEAWLNQAAGVAASGGTIRVSMYLGYSIQHPKESDNKKVARQEAKKARKLYEFEVVSINLDMRRGTMTTSLITSGGQRIVSLEIESRIGKDGYSKLSFVDEIGDWEVEW